jgi:aminopeptidase N
MNSESNQHKVIRREEYTPYPWMLDSVDFRFDLDHEDTVVTTEMAISCRAKDRKSECIVLDGVDLELLSVELNGRQLSDSEYEVGDEKLSILNVPADFRLKTKVRIHPASNTALTGLYTSSNFLLTQCEAEGFRRITFFPDRPDVMTRYRVMMIAKRDRYPILLSNGNAVDRGDLTEGRHYVLWEDPFNKPSYLFALVAGDLAHIEETFTTMGGREVALRVWVEQENIDRCQHALDSLIAAMKWDEQRFGLEYDLDVYNIVATNDFNMGAMENKSLNIFNSKFVLARADTATDDDLQRIEGVIGHEYFHNWTGNRVTCRDWFQLTLKEGLTVFRDQEFTSDLRSRAVKRIQDVRMLRNRQFVEDAGSMAHPIRPDSYVEINNFYTLTVYEKGAEIIRMYHTLLGEEGFQRGMKLYFERHDGCAVTCDDFLAAMADANDIDLGQFGRWYSQAGTPEVTVTSSWDSERRIYELRLKQRSPAKADPQEEMPLVVPIAMALLDRSGRELRTRLKGEAETRSGTRLLILDAEETSFEFQDVDQCPIPSLLRGFSAPVKLHVEYSDEELALLMTNDSDPFAGWEASQRLMLRAMLKQRERLENGHELELDEMLKEAVQRLLLDRSTDPALLAEQLRLPSEEYVGEQLPIIDVDGIHTVSQFLRRALAAELNAEFCRRYEELDDSAAYDTSQPSMARRSLKNACLAYLVESAGGADRAHRQFQKSDNMTDSVAALIGLVHSDADSAMDVLKEFERKFQDDALVMDKWFTIQVTKPGSETVQRAQSLLEHPAFSLKNPNKVRAVIGAFAMFNPTGFHAASGAGYQFVADQISALDSLNPQIAARMATCFNNWKRYDRDRQRLMQEQLRRLADGSLSRDTGEIVTKALS